MRCSRTCCSAGFSGVLYPVNRDAEAVSGVLAYPTLHDVPGDIDLVVVAVPAAAVESVIAEAGEVGVGAAVIVSAGFAEVGAEGAATQDRVVKTAHRHGMRVVGPNCIGVVNTDPAVGLNATFSPVAPRAGSIGFASQSGALGIAILSTAERFGLGVSSFVSLGNKADVSGNDLLQYWLDDEDDRRWGCSTWSRSAIPASSAASPDGSRVPSRSWSSRVADRAPRSGPPPATRRRSPPTTPSPTRCSPRPGIIRVATLEELFDVGRVLVHQPLPSGGRVAHRRQQRWTGHPRRRRLRRRRSRCTRVVRAPRRQTLRAALAGDRWRVEPCRCDRRRDPSPVREAVGIVLADDDIDAVLTIFTDPMVTDPTDVANAIARAVAAGPPKPVAATFLGGEEPAC